MRPDDEPFGDRSDPGEGAAEDAWVRELLADARVTGPVPPEVAARLDDTLASLQAERAAGADRSGVVPLRRRLAPALAAAVVLAVAGLGISHFTGGDPGSDVTASDGAAPATVASPGAGAGSGPDSRLRSSAPPVNAPEALVDKAARLPALSRQSFTDDAEALARGLAADAVTPAPVSGDTPGGPVSQTSGDIGSCPGPVVADGVTVRATLDGTPVVVVLRPPAHGVQQVEAWSCDGGTVLASAEVRR